MGFADTAAIAAALWFACAVFETPQVNWQAALFMLPVAIAPAIEHIGGIMAIGNVTGKQLHQRPGFDKTLAGDGLGRVWRFDRRPAGNDLRRGNGRGDDYENSNPVIMTWRRFLPSLWRFSANSMLPRFHPSARNGRHHAAFVRYDCFLGIKTLVDAKVDLMQPKIW